MMWTTGDHRLTKVTNEASCKIINRLTEKSLELRFSINPDICVKQNIIEMSLYVDYEGPRGQFVSPEDVFLSYTKLSPLVCA